MHKFAKLQPKKFIRKRQLLKALTQLPLMLSLLDKMWTCLPSTNLSPPRRRLSQSPKHLYQILYLILIPLHHFHSSNHSNTHLPDAFFCNPHLSSNCTPILICRNHHHFHNSNCSNTHLSDTLFHNTHLSRNCNSLSDLFCNTYLSNNTNISLSDILSNHTPNPKMMSQLNTTITVSNTVN